MNGIRTTLLGTVIAPGDRVTIDGTPLSPPKQSDFLILNKPRGYITTLSDERQRPTVMDLVPEKYRRRGVRPVGRLDLNSEGLLLLTNDGELAHRLTKPRFHVPKEYLLEIDRPLAPEDESRIREGVYLHQLGIKTRSARVHCNDDTRQRVTIILSEGKKRQVRYTLGNLGYKVRSLERTAYGPLTLRRLRRGTCRPLTRSEIRDLKRLVGLESAKG